MPQSLPNEALGDAKGVNQARYHVEMTPESCSAVHPNMVPNAPNILQNMARYTFHMQRPRNLLFGDLQQTVLLLLSNICACTAESILHGLASTWRRRGWWWVSKAAPQLPTHWTLGTPKCTRRCRDVGAVPCNTNICGGQRQLTTHAQDHKKIIAHSCGNQILRTCGIQVRCNPA